MLGILGGVWLLPNPQKIPADEVERQMREEELAGFPDVVVRCIKAPKPQRETESGFPIAAQYRVDFDYDCAPSAMLGRARSGSTLMTSQSRAAHAGFC